MAVKPMLDDIELKLVQKIEADAEQVLDQHSVPALEGDFLQGLGRRATRVTLVGVMTGPESSDDLKTLRDKFRSAVTVSFVSDIATATRVDDVLIEEMGVREIAGKSQRFEFELTLRELIPAPPQQSEIPPPPPPLPIPDNVLAATLIVEVIVEGQPDFDFSKVTVTIDGQPTEGPAISGRTLTNRVNNIWTEEDFPPGQFTARARVSDPEPMTGSAAATVREGQTTSATIVLRPGVVIATAFVVHFRFDNAFVEPCMREVLQQVMARADDPANASEKVLVVGHTDKTGSDQYNQSLSERRARSVYAYLTSGRDPTTSQAEWNTLRLQALGGLPQIRDTWGARQYQYMLGDLGFYPGKIDGDHGTQTNDAVRSFRAAKGLPPGTQVDDPTWRELIKAYMEQDQDVMVLPEDRLLPNAKDACNGGALKWLGVGEQQPLPLPFEPPTEEAWRPYRRVEILFVEAERLPCDVPQPDTFNLPAPGAVNPTWCLGPGNPNDRACFGSRECDAPEEASDHWCITDAETATVVVRGSFKFEDESPAPNVKYILMASDGEFMDGENRAGPTQNIEGVTVKRGEGFPGRSGPDGTFAYPDNPKRAGIFIIEVQGPFIARLREEPPSAAKGTVVCKHMDGSSDFDVILTSRPTSLEFVDPNNVETLVTSVRAGDTMRVRADIPGMVGDVATVQITGDRLVETTPGGGGPPPPGGTTSLEFVDQNNVETLLTSVRAGDTVRLRADAPGTTGDEITVQITSLPTPS